MQTATQAQVTTLTWHGTNAPKATRYDDLCFLTPDMGWAVNSNGEILRTVDGGATWERQLHLADANQPVWLRTIGFANGLRGWVGTVTPERRLYETDDGGATWNVVTGLPALAPEQVCGLSVVNQSVVYASGTNHPDRPARMMKTTDGGATWTAWDMSPHASLLVDTYFTTPERGWVVGGKVGTLTPRRRQCTQRPDRQDIIPVVLFTEDGGRSWTNQVADLEADFPLGEWGWKIFFVNDRVGFVSLENFCEAAILKTTDGGQTWQRLAVNDPQHNVNLEGVGFIDEQHGWVGGWGPGFGSPDPGGLSSTTVDGGATWNDANEIGRFINRFRFLGDPVTVGYAGGSTVYKYSAEPRPMPAPAAAMRLLEAHEPVLSRGPVRIPITVPESAGLLLVNVWERFGDHVRRLVHEAQPPAGPRTVEWDLTNDAGEALPPGSFVVRVTVDDHSESRMLYVQD